MMNSLALASSVALGASAASQGGPGGVGVQPSDDIAAARRIIQDFSTRKSGRKPRGSRAAGFATSPEADAGVLSAEKAFVNGSLEDQCEEWVDCFYGYVNGTGIGGIECAEACQGRCCTGGNACIGFLGKVCKDNFSCTGYKACFFADIDYVNQGCHGERSCMFAGYDTYDKIDYVMDGCDGSSACAFMEASKVQNSCLGDQACLGAGLYATLGEIKNSCNGTQACYYAAYDYYGGSIQEIIGSCNDERACFMMSHYYGDNIGSIWGSCNAFESCLKIGYNGLGTLLNISDPESSTIPEMTNCCNEPSACREYEAADLSGLCTAPSSAPSDSPRPSSAPSDGTSGKSGKSKSGKAKSSGGKSSKKSDSSKALKTPEDAWMDGVSMSAAMSLSLDFEPV